MIMNMPSQSWFTARCIRAVFLGFCPSPCFTSAFGTASRQRSLMLMVSEVLALIERTSRRGDSDSLCSCILLLTV